MKRWTIEADEHVAVMLSEAKHLGLERLSLPEMKAWSEILRSAQNDNAV
jgi:hypothetical protein